ncbi:heterokaryon incompatibility protein-domain-containing protein [Xylaria sp. FL1042]|nr:heterokaryon incompatibility protein-domain-containing protein [Xylaria sp. FL1042]
MVHYKPLDATRNEIRVIHLHPGASSSAGSVIECTLEHVPLDQYTAEYRTLLELDAAAKPPVHQAMLWDLVTTQSVFIDRIQKNPPPGRDFFALSYEWGDLSDTDEIIVNGESTTVTKPLKNALQRLRTWWRAQYNNDSVCLWIDALCISQGDIPERNSQIRRMRQIYSTAIKVLIMTGPDVEAPQTTSELLDRIFKATLKGDISYRDSDTYLLGEEYCSARKGVCEIAGRSYWRRLWVIQEAFLANTGAWLCYGDRFCLASLFFEAVAFLIQNIHQARGTLGAVTVGASEDWLQNVDKVESFLYLENVKHQGVAYPDLMHLLDMGRKAKQFDPRDKVYGLLGMVKDKIHVSPDYRLSLGEVYRKFAEDIIKATGCLSIIYQRAAHRTAVPSWPSWVPDWSANGAKDEAESIAATAYRNTCAAGDSLHKFKIPDNPNHLHCEGFMIDTVDQLACSGKANADHNIHNTCSRSASQESTSIYKDSAAVVRAFWNSLTLNQSAIIGGRAMDYLLSIPNLDRRCTSISFLHVIDRFQQCNQNLLVAQQPLISHFPPWSQQYSEVPSLSDITSTLGYLMIPMMFRRFMVTEKGRVGMVPQTAKLGDAIFILKGCNAPLILRPARNGAYSVVGECSVDGVMHGEAVEDLEAGRYRATEIIIC